MQWTDYCVEGELGCKAKLLIYQFIYILTLAFEYLAWVMGHQKDETLNVSGCNEILLKGWLGSGFKTGLGRTCSNISAPWYQKEQPAQVIGIPPGFHPLEIFGQIKLGRDPGICWRNYILSGKEMPGDSSRRRNWRTLPRRKRYRESSA